MNPNPTLRYRNITGLGDLIACILHCKLLNWLTVLISGKEVCEACNQRRMALNILLPLPIWKFSYKDSEEFQNLMNKEIAVYLKNQTKNLSTVKEIKKPSKKKITGYTIINESDNVVNDLLIKLIVYKKN
jgi:hypothetical protein